ncbi:Inner membrane protein YbjJ [compost metagenome]
MGWADIALNVEASFLEKLTSRQILTNLHANFSLGSFFGALIGYAATHFNVSLMIHMTFIATIAGGAAICITDHAFKLSGIDESRGTGSDSVCRHGPVADWQLVLICIVVLTMALIEGAANDWLPLLMIEGYGFTDSGASLLYMIFTLFITVGRFMGGAVVQSVGRTNVIISSAIMSALGILLIFMFDSKFVVVPAIVLWSMGAALGFPVSLSAAGAAKTNGEGRVKIAATAGYMAFLVGPPMLGFLGQAYGLRTALLPVLGLTLSVLSLVLFCGGRRAIK